MSLSLGILSVRGADFHPNRRLLAAAAARGVPARLLNPYHLGLALGREGAAPWPAEDLPRVALPRQGSTLGEFCLLALEQLEFLGTVVLNPAQAVRLASHKFLSLQALARAGLPTPRSLMVAEEAALEPAAAWLDGPPVVAKRLRGSQGNGVALLRREGLAARAGFGCGGAGTFAQEYLPPAGRRDLRVLVVGERVAGAMELAPLAGDFRANFHLSGRARPVELPPPAASLALAAARALGLAIAGVDLIWPAGGAPLVLEANYAPGFAGLEAATGLDIAGAMLDLALARGSKEESPCGSAD